MDSAERSRIRRRLLAKLKDSFIYSREPVFTLSSGRKSHFYIDSRRVTLDPEGGYLVGQLVLDAVADLEPDAIGGMTLGADPLAVAAAILSYGSDRPIPAFLVRKEARGEADSQIEGSLRRESSVVVVDDVLTGGRATERVIRIVERAGARVLKVVALVDRREGGREYLEQLGYSVNCLFTVEDLLKA